MDINTHALFLPQQNVTETQKVLTNVFKTHTVVTKTQRGMLATQKSAGLEYSGPAY